jgi:hypothetical protein
MNNNKTFPQAIENVSAKSPLQRLRASTLALLTANMMPPLDSRDEFFAGRVLGAAGHPVSGHVAIGPDAVHG